MWIHVPQEIDPSTSCPSAQDTEGSSSESDSLSDSLAEKLALSVTWRSSFMRPQYWRLAWRRDGSILRLFGRTLRRSQRSLDDSVARWISSLEATPASPSATPASGAARKTPDTCSRIYAELSRQLDLFSASSRTSRGTSRWDSRTFTRAFVAWITELRSEYSRRLSAVRRTNGNGSSSSPGTSGEVVAWPTPSAQLGSAGEGLLSEMTTKDGRPARIGERAYAPGRKWVSQITLARAVALAARAMWQTPTSSETEKVRHPERLDGGQPSLAMETTRWPTPRASEEYQGEETERGHATGEWDCTPRGATVETAARAWATPRASEADRGPCPVEMGRKSPGIKAQAQSFPTPTGRSAVGRAPGQTQLDIFAREMMEEPRESFPTPTRQDAGSSGCAHLSTDSGRHTGATLTDVAIRRGVKEDPWTTPTSRDAKGMSSESRRADPDRSTANLADQALDRWATPEAHNAKGCRGAGSVVQEDLGRQATKDFPSGPQDQETPTHGDGSSSEDPTSPQRWPSPQASDTVNKDQSHDTALSNDEKMPEFAKQRGATPKRLNPRFVEWMMGLPTCWSTATTGSGCSETEWFLWWRDALYCICSLER